MGLITFLTNNLTFNQGHSDGGWYIGIYTLPKSGQVNFLWSKNDATTAIELSPQWVLKLIPPQDKFLATPLLLTVIFLYDFICVALYSLYCAEVLTHSLINHK